jgi:hypothetical protein
MNTKYQHFDSLRDAKATLAQQIGTVEISFFRSREDHSIYRVRRAGTQHFFATLYEGPDCYLMVSMDV